MTIVSLATAYLIDLSDKLQAWLAVCSTSTREDSINFIRKWAIDKTYFLNS